MVWLKIISKFVKAFHSGESPGQIAVGFAIGFFIGLMPFWTLQTLILFFILILVNINLAAATVAFFIANMIAYLLDPIFHSLGYYILTQISFLQGTWEAIYNSVFGPLTRFYNTVVMGSFVSGLILFLPIYFGMKKFVLLYRERLEEKIKKWKIVQVINGSKMFQFYEKVRDLGGN